MRKPWVSKDFFQISRLWKLGVEIEVSSIWNTHTDWEYVYKYVNPDQCLLSSATYRIKTCEANRWFFDIGI